MCAECEIPAMPWPHAVARTMRACAPAGRAPQEMAGESVGQVSILVALSSFGTACRSLHMLPFLVEFGECQRDTDCRDDEACVDHYCQNPCDSSHGHCGENAECHTTQHVAICQCPAGWAGLAHERCYQCKMFSHGQACSVCNYSSFVTLCR